MNLKQRKNNNKSHEYDKKIFTQKWNKLLGQSTGERSFETRNLNFDKTLSFKIKFIYFYELIKHIICNPHILKFNSIQRIFNKIEKIREKSS